MKTKNKISSSRYSKIIKLKDLMNLLREKIRQNKWSKTKNSFGIANSKN